MIQHSAGLLIIKNNKILLCHPTGTKRQKMLSIPKGHIEEGEDKITAAIRETYEETGIKISESQIVKTEYVIEYRNKHNKLYKKVYYFTVNLKDIEYPDILNKNQLQLEEVDWAGF